jgi:hypothetical protein
VHLAEQPARGRVARERAALQFVEVVAETDLSCHDAGLRDRQVECGGSDDVPRHAASEPVHRPQLPRAGDVALPARRLEPSEGLGLVRRDAFAAQVSLAEVGLRGHVALLGGPAVPGHGFRLVHEASGAAEEHRPEIVLGMGIALRRAQAVPLERLVPVLLDDRAIPIDVAEPA